MPSLNSFIEIYADFLQQLGAGILFIGLFFFIFAILWGLIKWAKKVD